MKKQTIGNRRLSKVIICMAITVMIASLLGISEASADVTLTGRVVGTVNGVQQGISGVNVNCDTCDSPTQTSTGGDGRFSLSLPNNKTLDITFSKDGFTDRTRNVNIQSADMDLGDVALNSK